MKIRWRLLVKDLYEFFRDLVKVFLVIAAAPLVLIGLFCMWAGSLPYPPDLFTGYGIALLIFVGWNVFIFHWAPALKDRYVEKENLLEREQKMKEESKKEER